MNKTIHKVSLLLQFFDIPIPITSSQGFMMYATEMASGGMIYTIYTVACLATETPFGLIFGLLNRCQHSEDNGLLNSQQ
jgi:hypothetical protein